MRRSCLPWNKNMQDFNWNNRYLHAVLSPPYACGQWLINCLSHSKHLCPCVPTQSIEYILKQRIDSQTKHHMLLSHLPNKDKDSGWHYASQFYDSIRWLNDHEGYGFNMEDGEEPGEFLFQKATSGMRDYINQYWRQHAKMVSHSGMGFLMKLHYGAEADGWLELIPQSKIFTVSNYDKWQDVFVKKSKTAVHTVAHWRQKKDYQIQGFVFDIDQMIRDEAYFSKTMQDAYEYIDLNDYNEVSDFLIEYRKAYLISNLQYTN